MNDFCQHQRELFPWRGARCLSLLYGIVRFGLIQRLGCLFFVNPHLRVFFHWFFREWMGGGKTERERKTWCDRWIVASCTCPTRAGDQVCNQGTCSWPELKPEPFSPQADVLPTEPNPLVLDSAVSITCNWSRCIICKSDARSLVLWNPEFWGSALQWEETPLEKSLKFISFNGENCKFYVVHVTAIK